MESWSVDEVQEFFRSLDASEEVLQTLRKEVVDGAVLASLSEGDMKELGLPLGLRRKVTLRLKEGGGAAGAEKKTVNSAAAPTATARATSPTLTDEASDDVSDVRSFLKGSDKGSGRVAEERQSGAAKIAVPSNRAAAERQEETPTAARAVPSNRAAAERQEETPIARVAAERQSGASTVRAAATVVPNEHLLDEPDDDDDTDPRKYFTQSSKSNGSNSNGGSRKGSHRHGNEDDDSSVERQQQTPVHAGGRANAEKGLAQTTVPPAKQPSPQQRGSMVGSGRSLINDDELDELIPMKNSSEVPQQQRPQQQPPPQQQEHVVESLGAPPMRSVALPPPTPKMYIPTIAGRPAPAAHQKPPEKPPKPAFLAAENKPVAAAASPSPSTPAPSSPAPLSPSAPPPPVSYPVASNIVVAPAPDDSIEDARDLRPSPSNSSGQSLNRPLVERTVLLLGSTGQGKSTLANALTGSHEETFVVGHFGASCTKDAKMDVLEVDGMRIKVVDTIGIGDTQLSDKQVLLKLSQTMQYLLDGVSQIFYVFGGRFSASEVEAFKMIVEVVLSPEALAYTTLIRSKFKYFDNPRLCSNDRQEILRNEDTKWIAESCASILWVDNDPSGDSITRSRSILLDHLRKCDRLYKPQELRSFSEKVCSSLQPLETTAVRIDLTTRDLAHMKAQLDRDVQRMRQGDPTAGASVQVLKENVAKLTAQLKKLQAEHQAAEERLTGAMQQYVAVEEKRQRQKFATAVVALETNAKQGQANVHSIEHAKMLQERVKLHDAEQRKANDNCVML